MFIHFFEILIISFHSDFDNGITDKRDCFINIILDNFELFFISSSVTGLLSFVLVLTSVLQNYMN